MRGIENKRAGGESGNARSSRIHAICSMTTWPCQTFANSTMRGSWTSTRSFSTRSTSTWGLMNACATWPSFWNPPFQKRARSIASTTRPCCSRRTQLRFIIHAASRRVLVPSMKHTPATTNLLSDLDCAHRSRSTKRTNSTHRAHASATRLVNGTTTLARLKTPSRAPQPIRLSLRCSAGNFTVRHKRHKPARPPTKTPHA